MRWLGAIKRSIGRAPIHPVPFVAAKLALVAVIVPPVLQLAGVPIRRTPPALVPVALALAIAALVLLFVAMHDLGTSLRVGLPNEETTLRTSGIYRFSRHPIYLAIFALCAGAALFCPHPAVIASALVCAALHHRIALAEETFLERRFGDAWRAHAGRTPRYVGLPRQQDASG